VEHQGRKVVYRRYASLFFIVGIDHSEVQCSGGHPLAFIATGVTSLTTEPQNELAVYEFIHNLVELFDRYFRQVVRSLPSLRVMRVRCQPQTLTVCCACVGMHNRARSFPHSASLMYVSLSTPSRSRVSYSPAQGAHQSLHTLRLKQIMFNLEKAHILIDEMVVNGCPTSLPPFPPPPRSVLPTHPHTTQAASLSQARLRCSTSCRSSTWKSREASKW
jgi:hypothetical protein